MDRLTKSVRVAVGTLYELSAKDRELVLAALVVRNNAQAPYSGYHVGCAVRAENGRVFTGCNVERCSYSEATHAEQNAIDSMVAALGPSKLTALAFIAAPADSVVTILPRPGACEPESFSELAVPCGHCLQIIWENCDRDRNVKLISLLRSGYVCVTTIGDTFPISFGPGTWNAGIDK